MSEMISRLVPRFEETSCPVKPDNSIQPPCGGLTGREWLIRQMLMEDDIFRRALETRTAHVYEEKYLLQFLHNRIWRRWRELGYSQ